jgi:hypothetical protein
MSFNFLSFGSWRKAKGPWLRTRLDINKKLEWAALSLFLAFNHLPLAVLPELFSQSQALNDRSVTFRILLLHIVQKPSPLADEFQQTPAGMVVLFMLLEMIGQVSDASTQERDLNFRRPCIGRVQLETTDNPFSFFYI